MLPEWTLPYWSENYTGPFVSDGRFQESVADGRAPPKSRLDVLSREHDAEYYRARQMQNRAAASLARRRADFVYFGATRSMGWFPRFAGDLVLYYNQPDCRGGSCRFDGSGGVEVVGGGVKMGNGASDYRMQPGQQRNPGDANFLRGSSEYKEISAIPAETAVCYAPEASLRGSVPQLFYRPQAASTASPEYVATENPRGEYAASSSGGAGVAQQFMRPKRRRRVRR